MSPAPIGDSLRCIEPCQNLYGPNVHCSFEQTDILQVSNDKFYHNRLYAGDNKAIWRLRNQFLLDENTLSIRYSIPGNNRYRSSSTDWTLLSVSFFYPGEILNKTDQIDTSLADIDFGIVTKTRSVY